MNEIYLGLGAYGIASASLTYFDKAVNELTVPEAAYLAALPKAPNNYHPFRARERALERRNWVIDQMAQDGFITSVRGRHRQAHAARRHPEADQHAHLSPRNISPRKCGANYTTATARRSSTTAACRCAPRSTPSCRCWRARRSPKGWCASTRRKAGAGRSPRSTSPATGASKLADVKALADVAPWRLAVVLETGDQSARIGLQPGREPGGDVSKERDVGIVPIDGVKWAKVDGKP